MFLQGHKGQLPTYFPNFLICYFENRINIYFFVLFECVISSDNRYVMQKQTEILRMSVNQANCRFLYKTHLSFSFLMQKEQFKFKQWGLQVVHKVGKCYPLDKLLNLVDKCRHNNLEYPQESDCQFYPEDSFIHPFTNLSLVLNLLRMFVPKSSHMQIILKL